MTNNILISNHLMIVSNLVRIKVSMFKNLFRMNMDNKHKRNKLILWMNT